MHLAYHIRQIHSGPTASVSYKLADRGINYDTGKWFFGANTGCRIGPVAPYVQFSKLEPVTKLSGAGIRTVAQHPSSVGLRWDFMSNFALKGQYDHVKIDNSSTGTLVNVQIGLISNRAAEFVSFALECVF